MLTILLSLTLLTPALDTVVTPEERAVEALAVGAGLTPGGLQELSTRRFFEESEIVPIAGPLSRWMGNEGVDGPVAFFDAEVSPLGGVMRTGESIYFFATVAWGLFYVHLGGPGGIRFGTWSVDAVPAGGRLGRGEDPCKLRISLRSLAFRSTFDFDACRPLESMRSDYFSVRGLGGSVVLTPGA